MNIPPKGTLSGRSGKQNGLTEAIKQMEPNSQMECSLDWESGIWRVAKKYQMELTTRRIGGTNRMIVYRLS